MEEMRWEAVQAILSRALDLSAEQRPSAVRAMCSEDEELFQEVMELLEEDARSHSLLDSNVHDTARHMLDFGLPPSLIQRQIGPYRLLDLLGEGGMGVVYLAERTDIGGRVAIKLLRDAWLSPMRRERFRIEQLTLAQLNHPSIARIYDSNTLEDGTPWFVMEYAEGLPLTEYWRRRTGSPKECLQLMRKVCEAVQYAHSHAIIHRDIKPSNILVNENGEVKLLDFGIAKQLNLEEGAGRATVTGLRLMTLSYAAPEQLAGGPVGMFTDVYALGVLLFELLAERLPHRQPGSAHESAPADAERPSSVIRRERPEFYQQLGKGEWTDIDSLTLKALAPEANRRYGTVDALIRDIDAFRDGRPLEARPLEWRYALNKFTRRNFRVLATSTAALLFVATTVFFYTVRVSRARDEAVREAARTLRIQQFTENLFDGGDSSAGPSANLRVVDLLDRGRKEAESLGGDPLMQADMRETLGGIYQKLGKLEFAEPLLLSALNERRKALGSNDQKVGESLVAVGLLRKDQGRLDEADRLARAGLEVLRRSNAKPEAVAHATVGLGEVLEVRGKYDEASGIFQAALKLEPQGTRATVDTAENLTELANVLFYKGQYDQSEQLNRQSLDIYRRLYGEEHPAIADVENNLGAIDSNHGNYVGAEAHYRRALKIDEAWYGPNHPETAANLTALAQQLSYQKRDEEAQTALQRALEIQSHVEGGITSTVATTQNQLGLIALNRKQYDLARSYFTQAMQIWMKTRGERHEFVAVAYSNLGTVCLGENNLKCAETNFREAVSRLDAQSKGTLNAAIAHLKLGRCLLRESRFVDAEVETSLAYQYLVKNVAAENSFLAASRKDLAAIYDGLHRTQDASHFRSELTLASAKP